MSAPSTESHPFGGEKRHFEGAVNTTAPGQNPQNSDRIVALEGNGESHADYRFTIKAIEFMEAYRDKPFLLMFGLTKPHSPPTAPKRMIEMYDAAHIAVAGGFRAATKFGNNIGKAVRTERWRYAAWDDGGAMLFDRQKDPHELKNLAQDPAHAKVVKEMKALLDRMPK